jgi:NADPH:quinone reductase-like Zn-dependent oxidoreductase
MKAIILKGFGGIENLVEEDIAIPVITEKEVLVKVSAIGINPVDIKTREGKSQAKRLQEDYPMILGWDISGTVVKIGNSVSSFKTGDQVFGMINFPGHGRAYAEYVAAPASHLALKPSGISHPDAAASSLAALTAWQVIHKNFHLKPKARILIHSAAGGVGHFAVQFARISGAYIAGTASAKNRDFILSLGASVHIDYENEKFEDLLEGFDFVLDTIGWNYIDRSLKVLRPGGSIISIPTSAAGGIEEKAREYGMKGSTFLVRSDGSDEKEIAGLLKSGMVKPYISAIYSFNEIKSAHLQIETGRTKGKIVVLV